MNTLTGVQLFRRSVQSRFLGCIVMVCVAGGLRVGTAESAQSQEPESMHFFPQGLLYKSYLAGVWYVFLDSVK